jgi:hypothetical protein
MELVLSLEISVDFFRVVDVNVLISLFSLVNQVVPLTRVCTFWRDTIRSFPHFYYKSLIDQRFPNEIHMGGNEKVERTHFFSQSDFSDYAVGGVLQSSMPPQQLETWSQDWY